MLMEKYLSNHFVGEDMVSVVQSCIKVLVEYISGFPEVLKTTAHVTGSFASGMASRTHSCIDVLICMNGGQLTEAMSLDHLALALSTGLADSTFSNIEVVGNNTGIITAISPERSIPLILRVCRPDTFPVNHLLHSRLLTSYGLIDARLPVIVSFVKQWARTAGFSSMIPVAECPLSGFHWTVLTIYFLVESGIVPNLYTACEDITDLPIEHFGPRDRDAFISIPDLDTARRRFDTRANRRISVTELISDFFHWLSSIDLLDVCISLQNAGTGLLPNPTKGWIFIADPARSGLVTTIDLDFDQKSQVIFSLKLQREAGRMFEILKSRDERALVEVVLAKASSSSIKLDKAVP